MEGKRRGKYSGEGGPAAAFSTGDRLGNFVGANLTPNVISVNAGEDVAMKVISFSQQESHAICILSATGLISNVTLQQPGCSGGTLTYEGRFEILLLSESFSPTDNGIVKSRSGGMRVSLAGPDGRVLGGAIAGLLVAASPVQSDCQKLVMDYPSLINSLCSVLGLDVKVTVGELHTMLLRLWNLMDNPVEEQQAFENVKRDIAAFKDEIYGPNMLLADFIKSVEAEVSRLEELKWSKMKEIVLRKREELKEICRKSHMTPETDGRQDCIIEAIESVALDLAIVLEQIKLKNGKVKEEGFNRIEILGKAEKWLSAREEEELLEQYNMDDNHYNSGKGTHLTLRRAEKASRYGRDNVKQVWQRH